MKKNGNTAEDIVNLILKYYPLVQGIYLFGSYQTENEWPESDVDLALLFPVQIAKSEMNLMFSVCRTELETKLHKSVDLLNLRLVSTVFQHQIVNTGRLIYCGDKIKIDEFEMLTISYYQKLNEERRSILQEFFKTKRAYSVGTIPLLIKLKAAVK